jgi:hypothetical protein
MSRKLEVLVVESERGASQAVIDDLETAGHRVHRCHDPGRPTFPCNGLDATSSCPLDVAAIDVAVTVRGVPRSQPAVLEDGLTCAIKHHIPVVVSGRTALHPYEGYAAETVPVGEVVAAVERATKREMPEHQITARAALDVALRQRGLSPGSGDVRVERRMRGLHATVELPPDLDSRDFDMVAVRVMGALRAADRTAEFIDVAVAD